MKIRTIAIMLTLLVAGLAIGCSSAPTPTPPDPLITEEEAIEWVEEYLKWKGPYRSTIDRPAGLGPRCWDVVNTDHVPGLLPKRFGINLPPDTREPFTKAIDSWRGEYLSDTTSMYRSGFWFVRGYSGNKHSGTWNVDERTDIVGPSHVADYVSTYRTFAINRIC